MLKTRHFSSKLVAADDSEFNSEECTKC